METSLRTVYGAYLQTAQLLGLPVVLYPHTTLNEKFNINPTAAFADTEVPRMRYAAIGNGGHRMVIGANNLARPEPVQHMPRNAALYNHLPFVLREPANDLTAVERANYRLRRIESHDGKPYVAYYLKVLSLADTIAQMDYKTVVDGQIYSQSFEPAIGDLNPTPPDLSSTGIVTTTGDYISATAKVPFKMTEADIVEFMAVVNILYGDPNYAMITEIALCSGVDRSVIGDFNGISSGYVDVIGAQVVSFINTFYAMQFNNSGIELTLDVGSVESLLVLGR